MAAASPLPSVFVVAGLDMAVAWFSGSAFSGSALVKLAITAILMSNLRATWIAAQWVPGAEDAAGPPRRNETLSDKFVDQWPRAIWSVLRIPYYVFSVIVCWVILLGYLALLFKFVIRR